MACLVHTTGARRHMNDRKNMKKHNTHTHTHSIWRAYLTWRQARVAIVELRNCWKTRNCLQYSTRPFLCSVQIFLYVRWSKATASGKLLRGFLYCNEKYRRTVPGSASNCTKVGLAWWSSILTITKKSEKNGQSFPMLLFTPDKWAADNVAYMDMFPQCWSSLHTGSPSGSLSFFSCSMLLVLWINEWCWLISNILNQHSSCNILTCRGLSGYRSK